tara:strand:+ start:583 stop:684 length:102 start_codon:yes stop_codon:yes gene_type:complete
MKNMGLPQFVLFLSAWVMHNLPACGKTEKNLEK